MKSITVLSLALATHVSASYAPSYVVACPTTPSVRMSGSVLNNNQTINPDEEAYVRAKQAAVDTAFKKYLGKLSSTVYSGSKTPRIGISLSGGGDRAALFGASVLSALDGRNATSTATGLGGLLQSASYISALSGGSWLLSSLIFNDFPQIYPMVLGDGTSTSGWNLDFDVFAPGNTTAQETAYVSGILSDLALKKSAGLFNVTFNDYWARALSHHFLPGTTYSNFFDNSTDHGASITFSSATQLSSWKDHTLPFPVITSDVQSSSNKDRPLPYGFEPLSNVVYEFTPLEFGSYDPQLSAFIPMSSLGTTFNAGTPFGPNNGTACVNNFDNAGFLLGSSSCLFSVLNGTSDFVWTSPLSPINQAWTSINASFHSVQPNQELDIAAIPNPFLGLNVGTYQSSDQTQLMLVDGGEDGENNPLAAISVKARGLDVIIVSDASADTTTNMPNGEALIATQDRSALLANGTDLNLPPIPKLVSTFVSQGLNVRPTFFGCSATPAKLNGTAQNATYPIIVYIPNYDPHYITNTSTSQFVYPQASQFLDSGVAVVNRGIAQSNGTADPLFPTCLACAVIERVRAREGLDLTEACSACFSRYCWNEVEGVSNVAPGVNGMNSTTSSGSNATGVTNVVGSGSRRIEASITVLMGMIFLVVSSL